MKNFFKKAWKYICLAFGVIGTVLSIIAIIIFKNATTERKERIIDMKVDKIKKKRDKIKSEDKKTDDIVKKLDKKKKARDDSANDILDDFDI